MPLVKLKMNRYRERPEPDNTYDATGAPMSLLKLLVRYDIQR